MEQKLQSLYKQTEEIFLMTRKNHPMNTMSTDLIEIIKRLTEFRLLLTKLSQDKDGYLYKQLIKKQKIEANILNIYSFYTTLIQKQNNDIDNLQLTFLTQYILAKRINELEDLIQDLQTIIFDDEYKNLSMKQKKDIIQNYLKEQNKLIDFDTFSKNALLLIEILFKQRPISDLTNTSFDENDLDTIKDYDDEINNFTKKIEKDLNIFEYNLKILQTKNFEEFEKSEGPLNKEELNKNFKNILELYLNAPQEVKPVIIEQYKIEYTGITMATRVLELEILLQEYLDILK